MILSIEGCQKFLTLPGKRRGGMAKVHREAMRAVTVGASGGEGYFDLGSKTLRRPSPVKLKAHRVMNNASPGQSVRCQYSKGLSKA